MPFHRIPEPPMTTTMREACRSALHVVRTDGTVLRAGRAGLAILHAIGWTKAAWILGCRPCIWGVEVAYFVVARNRGFFARFSFRREDPDDPWHE